MTNNEAQAYAVVGLSNLIKNGVIKVKDRKDVLIELDREMYYLMDNYSEDEIVNKMKYIMTKLWDKILKLIGGKGIGLCRRYQIFISDVLWIYRRWTRRCGR